jgi:hypothetical protein
MTERDSDLIMRGVLMIFAGACVLATAPRRGRRLRARRGCGGGLMIAVGIMQFVVVSPILSFAPDEGNQIADKRDAFFIGPTGEIAGLPLLLGVKNAESVSFLQLRKAFLKALPLKGTAKECDHNSVRSSPMGIGFIKIGREDHEYLVLLPAMPNATHNSPTKSERGIGAHSGYRTGRSCMRKSE